ncbi:MAG: hypothetical protein AB1393_10615 [Candidatus Edwardsbacteria bacterium]
MKFGPEIEQFVEEVVNSFTKWELIKFFHENPFTFDTAERLAKHLGRKETEVKQAAEELKKSGLLRNGSIPGEYSFTEDEQKQKLVKKLVQLCADRTNRLFLASKILKEETKK